jgi:hypothetical protein
MLYLMWMWESKKRELQSTPDSNASLRTGYCNVIWFVNGPKFFPRLATNKFSNGYA